MDVILSIYSVHPQVTGREQDLTGMHSPVACRESDVRVFLFDASIRYKSDLVSLAGGPGDPLWGLHGRLAGKVTTFHEIRNSSVVISTNLSQSAPIIRIASCCNGC